MHQSRVKISNPLRRRTLVACAAASVLSVLAVVPADGQITVSQPRALALEDALRIAESASEEVGIARSSVDRSRGEQLRARSELFPQLFASAGYTRTLASQFDDIGENLPPRHPASLDPIDPDPSDQYAATCFGYLNPGGTLDERLTGLERAARCSGASPFELFAALPFGQKNQYQLGLSLSQSLFSGGRVVAQNHIASAGRRIAETALESARALLVLDVTQAYYNAALSDRLLAIAEATLEQSETTLRHTQLARQVGNQPEFELLRATVSRDNQRPAVIQRRADRDIAYLRLKQLLNLPLEESLLLNSALEDSVAVIATGRVSAASADTSTDVRAPVRQATDALRAQESSLRIARSQRLPAVSLVSQYGRVGYPRAGLPEWSDFSTNWTVGVNLQVPLFTGGRIRGDELVARSNVAEARLRLAQTRELAQLDARNAFARLDAAEASWLASAGTAQQAARAYHIAEIRYREGISTQTELSDSRILLQQAHANRALASRDLQVARARVALLRDLPLGSFSAPAAAGNQQSGPGLAPSQQQPPRQQPPAAQTGGVVQTSQTGAFTP